MLKKVSLFLLVLSILFFLHIKLPNLSIRLSDTNGYFYTAYKLLNQQLLYKDIFFTNFPLFPYISSIYYLITSGDIRMFYATALFEAITITLLIYLIVYTKTKNYLTSLISSLLYMFSFIVLLTSDHLTGVFTASIFSILAYIFLEKKYFLISGVFGGFALLTKAYFLPIILSFIIYLLFVKKEFKHLFLFLAGFLSFTILVLLPFFLFSGKEFISDLFYSTTRGGGVNHDVLWSFIRYDFILFSIFTFNLFNFKKNRLFAIISLISIVFLLFYQGLYYIYLNFLVPFLAISFYNLSDCLTHKRPILKTILPIIIFFAITTNITMYLKYFSNLEVIKDINSVTEVIKKENPEHLYGTPDITPAFAYTSGVPLLDNIIDTNPNAFRKKIFDSKKLTQKAIESKTIVITRGSDDKLSIANLPINEIFDKDILQRHCIPLASIPIYTRDEADRINLLKCY